MSSGIENMGTMVLDVLKEIGNIGAGNAATALAKLINKKVDMRVPKVNVMELSEVPELIGGAEKQVCGIFFGIEGDIEGSIMFLLEMDDAIALIDMLMPRDQKIIDEFAFSALQEIGNILAGSYISSLSSLTSLNIKITIPSVAVDMAGAILSVPAIEFGQLSDKIIIIENEFFEIKESDAINGYFFLIPDMDSYKILFNSLGIQL